MNDDLKLTELWTYEKLPEGYYYIRWSYDAEDKPQYMIDFYDRENFTNGAFINKQRKFIDEIVSSVPTYEQYNDLILQKTRQENAIELYVKELLRLNKQIEEANDILKNIVCSSENEQLVVIDYLNKWNVNNRKE